jgi:hypothetical protein
MGIVGGAVYACAFLLLPIKGLETEAARWRGKIADVGRWLGRRRG